MKLTTNTAEATLHSLLESPAAFAIPYFQREYKWTKQKFDRFETDVKNLLDGDDGHFFGAIIVSQRPTDPNETSAYDVIDGQQRLTTVFAYICAAVRVIQDKGDADHAGALAAKYLVLRGARNLPSNIKLQSGKTDRAQINWVIRDALRAGDPIFDTPDLSGFVLRPLPHSGKDTGKIRNAYDRATDFFESRSEQGGLEELIQAFQAMLTQISVVQINVTDPIDGPKIYDSLNSSQQPMTTGDLVKNEIFRRISHRPPTDIEEVDEEVWQPFFAPFREGGDFFDTFFFPYGLVNHPTLKKSDLFAQLRKDWRPVDEPKEIVDQLLSYRDLYLDLAKGEGGSGLPSDLEVAIRRMHELGMPSSAFPFFMRLMRAVLDDELPSISAIEIATLLESFFVRRGLSGVEPTGLHVVFKSLWKECSEHGGVSAERVEERIRRRTTVVWPSDDEFKNAVEHRGVYGKSPVVRHVLLSHNETLGGDIPGEAPQIEHVLPQKWEPSDWSGRFTDSEHASLHNTIGNLLPLTSAMNQRLGAGAYAKKRPVYLDESGFRVSREFAKKHEDWNAESLRQRNAELADWAVQYWSA